MLKKITMDLIKSTAFSQYCHVSFQQTTYIISCIQLLETFLCNFSDFHFCPDRIFWEHNRLPRSTEWRILLACSRRYEKTSVIGNRFRGERIMIKIVDGRGMKIWSQRYYICLTTIPGLKLFENDFNNFWVFQHKTKYSPLFII